DGRPQIVAIAGEAGVGKSTLVRQLLPEVRLRNGHLVMGRAVEADVKPPYGPWAEVLGAVRSRVDATGREWRELPRLLPSLGPIRAGAPSDGSGSKYVLYDEIVDFLRLAATSCPLVVVLDDMQWADSASWDTLEHLLTQLEDDRVMIALTLRAEDVNADVTARRRRLSRDERFQEIQLQRLTRDEVEQWLAAASQGQELGDKLLPALYRHTEGNPFLVLQVLRSLIEDGEILYADGKWTWRETSGLRLPVAVSDLMARRLERLAPRTRQILTTAAVIGRVFDIDLAVAAGAGTEDELLDAIDEAVAAAVLEPSRQDSDRFAFAHTLLVDSIRATANPRRLRRTHQAVAEALASRSPAAAAEIAGHYDLAGDAARTFHWAMRAGRQAKGVYAHDEAMSFFSMAHRHAEAAGDQLESALLVAQVAETAGRYAEGERLCNQTLAELAESPDVSSNLRRLRRHRERLRQLQGQSSRQTLEAYHRLLDDAEVAGDEAERIELLMTISQAQARLGDWPEAERVARDAIRRAEDLGDARLLADALVRLGATLVLVGNQEALQYYERASSLFTASGDWYGIVRCQINAGIVYSLAGDTTAAEAAYQRAVTLGREAHAPDVGGVASLNLGVLYMKAGRYDDAQQYFEEARRLFTQVKNEPHRLATLYNLGHLARERGEAERAVAWYDESAQLARQIAQADVEIGAIAGAGLAAWSLGRRDAALHALRDVEALIGGRREWWFQGRELVEALRVRSLHAQVGPVLAADALARGVSAAEAHDAYGAAWLVAELAPELAAAGAGAVWELVAKYAGRVDALGYAPLSRRYAALNRAQRLASAG
ncbi:MAG TPA: tetratricopeptide repeat protein, partial [Gemmatimonadaceae bacterium]|nr:tetratricopeptide repeat protein [Gemmatimonadaceae bacterium]